MAMNVTALYYVITNRITGKSKRVRAYKASRFRIHWWVVLITLRVIEMELDAEFETEC